MPQKPPIGKDAFPVTEEFFRAHAAIDLDDFYDRLLNETRRQIADLSQQGLSGPELADRVASALSDLSDKPIEESARKATTRAFSLGRNIEAQRRAEQIGEVIRTEILDENTCEPCRLLDGTRVTLNSEEYFQFMPPRLCDGRDFCRGFYIYEAA